MFEELIANPGVMSIFSREAIFVVLSLIVIEGLLSVDNALAIAAMCKHLEPRKRKIAMTVGYAGAYGFRILALLIAEFIIRNLWLMVLGACYLIWLMCNHFAEEEEEDARGEEAEFAQPYSFTKTIVMIAFLDLSLSFDNVVAAVAFARDNIWLVYLGVTIGIITLRLVAGYCIQLIARYPWLEHTAFILVGFVGGLLCLELLWDHLIKAEISLAGIDIVKQVEGGHYHIEKVAKFSCLVLIVVVNILYEAFPPIKKTLWPVMRVLRAIFAAAANQINALFRLLFLPVRKILQAAGRSAD